MDIASIPASQLAQLPALQPPPGVSPNFKDPAVDGSNARETIITTAFITALTIVALILRMYTKVVVLHNTGWDDYTSVGATVGVVAYTSLVIYVFKHGFGVHQWNVHLSTLLDNTSYLNGLQYSYYPPMLMAKLSICFFYYRIWNKDRKMRWAIIVAFVWNTLLQVSLFFLEIFLCIPGSPEYWQCTNRISVLNVVGSSVNVACDIYLLILPIFGISRLKMHRKQKWGLSFVFLIGLLALTSSILGVVYRVRQDRSSDITWVFAPEIILVLFEVQATIIAGCIMAIPALFKSTNPRSLASGWRTSREKLRSQSWLSSNSAMSDETSSNGPPSNLPRQPAMKPRMETMSFHRVSLDDEM